MESELHTWLKPLGLAHYADVLQGRSITLKMLAHLSEGELTALGFTVDDRRRLALALENARHAEAPVEELFTGQASAPSGPMTAERRWMTVLIFDLVNSTVLSDRLDPEVLREVLAQYQTAVIRAVHRHRGYVGRYEGDGIISTSAGRSPTKIRPSAPSRPGSPRLPRFGACLRRKTSSCMPAPA